MPAEALVASSIKCGSIQRLPSRRITAVKVLTVWEEEGQVADAFPCSR